LLVLKKIKKTHKLSPSPEQLKILNAH